MRRADARRRALIVAALLALALASGCAHAQAKTKTPEPVPMLTTPNPPSRLLIPVPPDSLLPPPLPPSEPPAPVTPARTGTTRTPPPVPPPGSTVPPPETPPPPVLQTASSLAILEAQARELLDRAQKDLARVPRASLGNDAQQQWDSAQRYVRLAKAAMDAKNFVYAKNCADKAAILASLLVK